MKELTSHLENVGEGSDKDDLRNMLRASVTLAAKGAKDKVFAVSTCIVQVSPGVVFFRGSLLYLVLIRITLFYRKCPHYYLQFSEIISVTSNECIII